MELASSSYIDHFVHAVGKMFQYAVPETLATKEWSGHAQQHNDPRLSFLEERLASLEGGVTALAVKSLRSARFKIIRNLLSAGDNIVTLNSWALTNEDTPVYHRLGVSIRLVEDGTIKTFKSLIDERTKLVYLETVSPHDLSIPDFLKVIAYAQSLKIPVVVDNTASVGGYLFAPLKHKANLVIESLEEYLPNSVGLRSFIVDGGNYNWFNGKFERLHADRLKFYDLKDAQPIEVEALPSFYLVDLLRKKSRILPNQALVPSDPFLLVRKLEEIPTKVKSRSNNARKLAEFLTRSRFVSSVAYTGLPSGKGYFQALNYFRYGFGHYVSFTLSVLPEAAQFFFEELLAVSLFRNKVQYDAALRKISIQVPAADEDELLEVVAGVFQKLREHVESHHVLHDAWLDYVEL